MPNYASMVKGKKIMMEKEKKAEDAGFKMLSMSQIIKGVFPSENLVIEVGEFIISMKVPNNPEPLEEVGKYLAVWERQKDGSLKIKIETWNTGINPMEISFDQKKKNR